MIGEVIKCDVDENGSRWGSTLQVLIEIDLQKPVSRGRTINVMGKKLWIPLAFEKLLSICFGCGRIIHLEGSCREDTGSLNNFSA